MRRIAAALLIASVLCACGQKGSLYLPDSERETISTTTPATAPAAAGATSTSAEERERENAARSNRGN